MNQLKIFNHEIFGELPVVIINETEWFGASEAAKALTFSNPRAAIISHVDDEDVTVHDTLTNSGTQRKKFVNESGLYSLIFGASKQGNNKRIRERAKTYKRWVTFEVLPSIRKHGAYMTPETIEQALLNPDTLIQLATNLKEEQQRRKQLEEQKKRDEPYTTFGKVVATSDASINIGSFAKLLYDKHGIKMGRNKLFAWLRDNGYLMRSGREKNQPKQQYIEQGLFETTVTMISRTHGDVQSVTTFVTGKGQVTIAKKILAELSVKE